MPTDPRDSGRWRALRKQLRNAATVCAICGRQLIHDAPPRSRWSPSIDHITPISRGGAPFDPANLRVTHYGCNAARGNRTIVVRRHQPPLWHSRQW